MDYHDYIPDFFADMIKSRRKTSLLLDSSRVIEIVHLIHLGVGDRPEVDQLKESLRDLDELDKLGNLKKLELNIDGPKEIHQDIPTPPRSEWFS
jgi:hypothetical protein